MKKYIIVLGLLSLLFFTGCNDKIKVGAEDDTATTGAGQSVTIDVLANDKITDDGNESGLATRVASVGAPLGTAPSHGVAVANEDNTAIIYTPVEGYIGTDEFGYSSAAGASRFFSATVTVTITDAPIADAGADKFATVDKPIRLTGKGTSQTSVITEYKWMDGNKTLAEIPIFDYVPLKPGKRTLTFTVTDETGATGSDDMNISIRKASVSEPDPAPSDGDGGGGGGGDNAFLN